MLLSELCLTSDCLSSCLVAYIGPNSKTKRPTKIKIGTEVAHVTRDSDTTFSHCSQKVKGQGHQAALVGCTDRPTWTYTVMVTYPYACITYIVSPLAGLGGGHIVAAARLYTACYVCFPCDR